MHSLRVIQKTACEWGVQHALPRLLRAPCAERTSEQGPGVSNVGSHSAGAWQSWPGKDIGIREPAPGETPLSDAEVAVAVKCGEADGWPMVRRIKPAGTWERKSASALAPPTPWEGLL